MTGLVRPVCQFRNAPSSTVICLILRAKVSPTRNLFVMLFLARKSLTGCPQNRRCSKLACLQNTRETSQIYGMRSRRSSSIARRCRGKIKKLRPHDERHESMGCAAKRNLPSPGNGIGRRARESDRSGFARRNCDFTPNSSAPVQRGMTKISQPVSQICGMSKGQKEGSVRQNMCGISHIAHCIFFRPRWR